MSSTKTYDVIVVGAGGAGMMAAAIAGQRGKSVVLIDHADQAGKKILISGGGRCNFTNLDVSAGNFFSTNRHFAKSALHRYTPKHFIDLVDRHKIAWHEKTLGQLFCDGSAKQIVAMLQDECIRGGVDTWLAAPISHIRHSDGRFTVQTDDMTFQAPAMIVASGGMSIPKLGASDFAYRLARQFGLKIIEPCPALVPLTLAGDEALFRELSGVSAEVVVRAGNTSFREAALFTHKGLSGPAILQISSYWQGGEEISINFFPDANPGWMIEEKNQHPKSTLPKLLAQQLPNRLAEALVSRIEVDVPLGSLSDKKLKEIEQSLFHWTFRPNGTEGFTKAEVTRGGVSTEELSSKTFETKKVSGLYFVGEAVDVTGWLGGYNFQWAWASGHAAGQAV